MSKCSLVAGITQARLFLAWLWCSASGCKELTCTWTHGSLSCNVMGSAASTEQHGSPVSPTSPLPRCLQLWGCCMEMDAVQTPAWVLMVPPYSVSSLATLTHPLASGWKGKGCQPGQPQGCPSTWIGVKPHTCRLQKPRETWWGRGMPSTALGHRGEQEKCMPALLGHSRGINKRSWKSKCAIKIMT